MPKLGLGLSLPQTKITGFDSDARAYIAAVEAADGQALESSVKNAINTFVVGCKADGIWNSIVASCIMAGARTVAGALVPLRGNAPTNNNFVAGDYSRTLGLLGNDSNKYLATGYNNNDTTNFPQNDSHISCYVTETQTDTSGVLVGTQSTVGNLLTLAYSSTTQIFFRNRAGTQRLFSVAPLGFQASTRNNSANFSSRGTSSGGGFSDATTTVVSGSPSNQLFGVFCGFSGATANQFSAARMSFYSIGKSLSIPNLDTRVTTLMADISSALPAPSGIPVASTASVVISGNATFNGTAVKKVNPQQCFGDPVFGGKLYVGSGVVYAYGLEENYGKILIPPQATAIDEIPDGSPQIDTPSNTWRLVLATYNSEDSSYFILNTSNNSSTDANYIPTTGWSPSITITAA